MAGVVFAQAGGGSLQDKKECKQVGVVGHTHPSTEQGQHKPAKEGEADTIKDLLDNSSVACWEDFSHQKEPDKPAGQGTWWTCGTCSGDDKNNQPALVCLSHAKTPRASYLLSSVGPSRRARHCCRFLANRSADTDGAAVAPTGWPRFGAACDTGSDTGLAVASGLRAAFGPVLAPKKPDCIVDPSLVLHNLQDIDL